MLPWQEKRLFHKDVRSLYTTELHTDVDVGALCLSLDINILI